MQVQLMKLEARAPLRQVRGEETTHQWAPACVAGLEGEALLCGLRGRGIAFWPEQQLRAEGFFKTPDVKLQARRARSPDAAGAAAPPPQADTACMPLHG